MLIAGAELECGAIRDVRMEGGRIAAIGTLGRRPGERVVAAEGGLLLPGLHDHHIHVAASVAARESVACGPPEVTDAAGFDAALRRPGTGWLRATGYHESVAGLLDAATLDAIVPDRPVRVQHRGGRMWFLNSAALERLLASAPPPEGLERVGGRFTGRLFDSDQWLRAALGSRMPSFETVGAALARAGVTGLTEMSPANDAAVAAHFAVEQARGALPQRVLLAGSLSLAGVAAPPLLRIGPAKLHLHDAALDPEAATAFVAAAHAQDRPVAIHCATEAELVVALAAIDAAGTRRGDRIEHASVAADWAVAEIARLGLAICSQPHFIAERGDRYLRDVAPADRPILYRLRAFLDAGVALAGGSDAPFGGLDPWAAMAAAVSRSTRAGDVIGAAEALTPEQALDLYLRDPEDLPRRRRLAVGMAADLCLIDRPWAAARCALGEVVVRATWRDGRMIFDGVDQSPVERGTRADPPA